MSRRNTGGEPPAHEDRRESGTRRAAQPNPPLIVFADDSLVQTLKLTELLTEAGYRVAAAPDGQTAVRFAQEMRPALVLLDLEMPGMGGIEACQVLKRSTATAHLPIVIFTAHDDPKRLVSAFGAGCAAYIVKGSADEVLLEKIARHAPLHNFPLKSAR